ncbi:MAG: bifunctional riboflavin kinase/FAD synthetase [Leadbetterella sp.]
MQIYHRLSDFIPGNKSVVTIGTFDGVHLGHQQIIQRLCEKAKEIKGESVVLTFWPHPRLIVSPADDSIKLLTTIDEKTDVLASLGVDHLLILPFTREFSDLSAEKYIEDVLIEGLNTKTLVIGYDHRFGKNREGGIEFLLKNASRYKLEIEEISRQEVENLTVSSTKIRNAILSGNVLMANQLLGRPYCFSGNIIKGRQLGRSIGFPTANVLIQKQYKLIPKNGVYACHILLRGKRFSGIMNIGNRPTVDGVGRTQEVHIFDFDDDIYGENLQVDVEHFIREEKKFENLDLLVAQIKEDCILAKKLLRLNAS